MTGAVVKQEDDNVIVLNDGDNTDDDEDEDFQRPSPKKAAKTKFSPGSWMSRTIVSI
jgi:hypothetical protein